MELTTLAFLLVFSVGFLGFDAAMHPPDAILEAEAIGPFDNTTVNTDMVKDVVTQEVQRISATPTLMTRPAMRVGRLQGLAMGLAESLHLESMAYAFQARLGNQPDWIKITLYRENGANKVLVAGMGYQQMSSFREELTQMPGETIVTFLDRASFTGIAHIDPYITALSEVQTHASDKNFTRAEEIIKHALETEPATASNFDRSLFENLTGLIALFRNDPQMAHFWFEQAAASCPDFTAADAVATLNEAFADVQLGNYHKAIAHIDHLMNDKPPTDPILISTAYMTKAAAQMGVWRLDDADRTIQAAVTADPDMSSSYDLWSDVKRQKGELTQALEFDGKAQDRARRFENYAEIATLYFRLGWRDNQPLIHKPFERDSSPGAVYAGN